MALVLLRAGFFMVFLPWMSWLLIRAFLPPWSVPAPGFGGLGIEAIVAVLVFLFGVIVWIQNPNGRGEGASAGEDRYDDEDESE